MEGYHLYAKHLSALKVAFSFAVAHPSLMAIYGIPFE